jgi:hypothetical protein
MRGARCLRQRPGKGTGQSLGVDVRQAQPWAHHIQSSCCPLLMEQETKEDSLIRGALSSFFDPGCVKTRALLRFSW